MARAIKKTKRTAAGGAVSRSAANPAMGIPWIYGPSLDLIVGCGAWSAPLLFLSYISLTSSARAWSVIFYVLALFFNYPHYMATIYRAYHRAEDFQKYRLFTVHTTALIALTLILSHSWVRLLPWIFTIYLTWSPWHYSGQNYGLFMMFARRAGAKPSPGARRALYCAFVVSYLVLFLGFHTGASTDSLFLSLGISATVSRPGQMVLAIAFVVLSILGLSRLACDTGWRKLAPSLTLLSSQFLWFLLPGAISLMSGLSIPQSRYSSGVLAVMHSAQYLWITSYYAGREARAESGQHWRAWGYFGVLMTGGIALFVPGPWLASRLFHYDLTRSFLIFTALVNLHHFILDGAIWKLRDGRIASFLLHSGVRISEAASETRGRLAEAVDWLLGNSWGARQLRVGAAALLVILAAADQVRYYLALHGENLADLRRAAELNGYDSSLQMRLARRELELGQGTPAEAAWHEAIAVNPSDPAPRQALLSWLIQQKRMDEAFRLTEASLRFAPKDLHLLVDRGLLAEYRSQPDVAIASWRQALDADPNHASAHLYLAEELDRQGKPLEAAEHYKAFLQLIGRAGGALFGKSPELPNASNRPAPEKIIAALIRMADCQRRAFHRDDAIRSYDLAERLAAQTKQGNLESVAEVNEAALLSESGRVDEALHLYQQALRLDRANGDDRASAEDWAAFGEFLNRAGFPPRLAYASFVKSETVKNPFPQPAQEQRRIAAKKQVENQLGPAASVIRRQLQQNLDEALVLRR